MDTPSSAFSRPLKLAQSELESIKLALDFALMMLSHQNMFCGDDYQEIVERMQSALSKLRALETAS